MDLITINFEMIKIPNHTRESHPCSNNDTCAHSAGESEQYLWLGVGQGWAKQWRVKMEGPLHPAVGSSSPLQSIGKDWRVPVP